MQDRVSLYDAAANGDVDAVRRLLGNGADVDKEKGGRSEYQTPLAVAAANGYSAVVDVLLQANADVDIGLDGRGSALLFACSAGHVAVAKALIAADADFRSIQSIPDRVKMTPLQLACHKGETAVAELLLDAGEQVDRYVPRHLSSYTTPLYEAADMAHPEIVSKLLARSTGANATASSGQETPLYAATCCLIPEYTGRGVILLPYGSEKEEVRDAIFQQLVDAGASMDDAAAFREAASLGQTGIVANSSMQAWS